MEQVYFENELCDYEECLFVGFYAKDEELLNVITESDLAVEKIVVPDHLKAETSYMNLKDTNSYIFAVNYHGIEIYLGFDGRIGFITEIKENNELVGVMIYATFGETSFNRGLDKCKELFAI